LTLRLLRKLLQNHSRFADNKATKMWANAQRDGLPAKRWWRPLFNSTKFG